MEHKFFHYTIALTLVLVVFAFLINGFFQNFVHATGILFGGIWGIVNLFLLKQTLREGLKTQNRNLLKLFLLLQIKFPFLYLLGYGLLRLKIFPASHFVLGFSLIFASIFLLGLFNYKAPQSRKRLS